MRRPQGQRVFGQYEPGRQTSGTVIAYPEWPANLKRDRRNIRETLLVADQGAIEYCHSLGSKDGERDPNAKQRECRPQKDNQALGSDAVPGSCRSCDDSSQLS